MNGNAPLLLALALLATDCGSLLCAQPLCERNSALVVVAGMAQEPMNSPVLAIGILLIFIGPFAFFAVLMRLA